MNQEDPRIKLIGKKIHYMDEICKIVSFDNKEESIIVSYTKGWSLGPEDTNFYNFENLTIGEYLNYVKINTLRFYDIKSRIKDFKI